MGTHSDVLKSSELFGAVSDDVIDDLATSMKLVGLQRGETLFRKGEYGDCAYIIADGQIRLESEKVELVTRGAVSVLVNMH